MTSYNRLPDSYWVYCGQLLAEAYPGFPNETEARLKVRSLLDVGVTVFIDVTKKGELKAYAEYWSRRPLVERRDLRWDEPSRSNMEDTVTSSRGGHVALDEPCLRSRRSDVLAVYS